MRITANATRSLNEARINRVSGNIISCNLNVRTAILVRGLQNLHILVTGSNGSQNVPFSDRFHNQDVRNKRHIVIYNNLFTTKNMFTGYIYINTIGFIDSSVEYGVLKMLSHDSYKFLRMSSAIFVTLYNTSSFFRNTSNFSETP